jgi:WD40 repeat protein
MMMKNASRQPSFRSRSYRTVELDDRPARIAIVTLAICLACGDARGWDDGPIVLRGHERGVYSVAFSPDGKLLASGDEQGMVKLWDMATLKEIANFEAHTQSVVTVAFSPNGELLASSSFDGSFRLWHVESRLFYALEGDDTRVCRIAFSPDGKTLASSWYDGRVRLWDVSTKKFTLSMRHHLEPAWSVAFTPDGKTLLSGSNDRKGMLKVWDAKTGRQTAVFEGLNCGLLSMDVSPDGKTMATAGHGGVRLWSTNDWKLLRTYPRNEKDASTNAVKFSPDGKLLGFYCGSNQVKLLDVANWEERRTITYGGPHHGIAFSPDGKTLATANSTHDVYLWDIHP